MTKLALYEIPEPIFFRILENKMFGTYRSAWIGNYWGKVRLDSMSATIYDGD